MTTIYFIIGVAFLVVAFLFSHKREHVLSPVLIVFSGIFILCGLFALNGLLEKLVLEQVACWIFASLFLVAAFRFLQRDKISLAFTVFILAAFFFFCSLSSVQSLLRTGMLSTVTDTLIDYTKKLDDFQLTVVKMKGDLYDQQRTNKIEQLLNQKTLTTVNEQQEKIKQQADDILALQATLNAEQSNLDSITLTVADQQRSLAMSQGDLDGQQSQIRHAQVDLFAQQTALTNQYLQVVQIQNQLATAETNLIKQNEKIGTVESLVTNLYSRSVIDVFDINDRNRVTIQPAGMNNTRIFFKLQHVPINSSFQASIISHPGLIRGFLGLFVRESWQTERTVFLGNNQNIAYCNLGVASWDRPEYPFYATFIIRYTRIENDTNLINKVELRGKDIYFDGIKQVFK